MAAGDHQERWPQQEADAALLEHLERRRHAYDQAMWQAPALTIAGQAFLLAVLTDQSVDRFVVRLLVLVAGVAAVFAAICSLARLRSREVLYSEAIAAHSEELGIGDMRPPALEEKLRDQLESRLEDASRSERLIRRFGDRLSGVYLFWIVALALFGVADLLAFLLR
jgi:cation transport ATPase